MSKAYIKAGQLEYFLGSQQPLRQSPPFAEPEAALLSSERSATSPYPVHIHPPYILKIASGIILPCMPTTSKRSHSFGFPQSKPSTSLSSPPCVPHRAPEIYFKTTYETICMPLYVWTDLNLIRPYVVSNISADAGTILERRNVSGLCKDSVHTAK